VCVCVREREREREREKERIPPILAHCTLEKYVLKKHEIFFLKKTFLQRAVIFFKELPPILAHCLLE
jgi:hypothetical protein